MGSPRVAIDQRIHRHGHRALVRPIFGRGGYVMDIDDAKILEEARAGEGHHGRELKTSPACGSPSLSALSKRCAGASLPIRCNHGSKAKSKTLSAHTGAGWERPSTPSTGRPS